MSHQAERGYSGNGDSAAATTAEHRREPRTLCNREIALMPLSEGDSATASERFGPGHLTDCSPHGLGLMLPSAMKAGQQVLVRLNLNNKMSLLVYTIRYCIPTKIGQYRAGARFTGYAASSFQGDLDTVVTALTGEP
jgi:hypothetical protein